MPELQKRALWATLIVPRSAVLENPFSPLWHISRENHFGFVGRLKH
jgi:hypothetical protein